MLETISAFEITILLFIQENLRCDFLNGVLSFITHLADNGYLWIAVGLILLIPKKTRRGGVDLLLCLALAFIVNDLVLKPLVARVRPYDAYSALSILVKPEISYSFPSGHTNVSFAAAYALTRCFGKKGAWSYVLAVLIAFSRLYVGVHYPTDVLGGMVVGTLCALLAYYLSKKYIKTDFVKKAQKLE